jgi:hypothetical protein
MNTPEFIKKIDWTDLRTQKTMLLETINNNAVSPEHKEGLEGILALIDALQDYAVDEMDVPEIHVYDFELEEERETDSNKPRTLYLCPNCGSDNVERKAWVNANTNEVQDGDTGDDDYCNDCGEHGELLLQNVKAGADVIGFQVVSNDGGNDIHPLMDGSFCLYNLSQAKEMLEDRPGKNLFNEWKLLAIWSGDVEEPTMMFEGDPRD